MAAPSIQDVSFYELVHKILTRQLEAEVDDDDDRRGRDRQTFATHQAVAPVVNGRMPNKEQLRDVMCRDLSTSGISFYASQPPESDQLLVRLTTSHRVTYLTAQVAHCRPIADGGDAAFIVGCRFTGRVDSY